MADVRLSELQQYDLSFKRGLTELTLWIEKPHVGTEPVSSKWRWDTFPLPDLITVSKQTQTLKGCLTVFFFHSAS